MPSAGEMAAEIFLQEMRDGVYNRDTVIDAILNTLIMQYYLNGAYCSTCCSRPSSPRHPTW